MNRFIDMKKEMWIFIAGFLLALLAVVTLAKSVAAQDVARIIFAIL